MRGIVMLDGPDGVGKTTLANAIAKAVGEDHYHYIHLSKPVDAWAEHRDALSEAIREGFGGGFGKVVVIDRHFMSESVYGQVYRRGSEYPLAARHVDRLLHRYGALRVVCAPPIEYVRETHERLRGERFEMYDAGMDQVARRYLDIWHGRAVNSDTSWAGGARHDPTGNYVDQLIDEGGVADIVGWHHYDVTTHGSNLKEYVDQLLGVLAENMTLTGEFSWVHKTQNLTGLPRRQAVLLVGDKVNTEGDFTPPFFDNAGSSLFLAKTLQFLHIDESRVCMINANDPGPVSWLRSVSQFCGRVIALGREAERKLELSKITYHARIRHPQHPRRFNHHDNSYAVELHAALNGLAGGVI